MLNREAPRLTIELVPKTCWFSNVRSNVSVTDWRYLSKLTAQQAHYQCEICHENHARIECHEVWYYHDFIKIQRLVRLIALCKSCHEVKHFGLAQLRGYSDRALAHLRKINNWSISEANNYINYVFKYWERRSNYQWALNIDFIKQHNINIIKK